MVLNILYNSSEMYYRPLYISILSLLRNNRTVEKIDIYVINDGFSIYLEEKLIDLINNYSNASIKFICPDGIKKRLRDNNVEKWAGSYSAYYKLFIDNELVNIDKLLYIDSDTIVCGDLSEVMRIPIDNYACSMAYELINPRIKEHYNINNEFYNSGIVLLNLKYWREHGISNLLFDKLSSKEFVKKLIFADQDLMILTIYEHIMPLKLEYNYTTMYELLYSDRFIQKNKLNDNIIYSKEEFEYAKNNPKIIHYLDIYTGRPWENNNNNPFKNIYSKYTNEISVNVNEPQRNRSCLDLILKTLVLFLCKIIPRRMSCDLIWKISDIYAKKLVSKHK